MLNHYHRQWLIIISEQPPDFYSVHFEENCQDLVESMFNVSIADDISITVHYKKNLK